MISVKRLQHRMFMTDSVARGRGTIRWERTDGRVELEAGEIVLEFFAVVRLRHRLDSKLMFVLSSQGFGWLYDPGWNFGPQNFKVIP